MKRISVTTILALGALTLSSPARPGTLYIPVVDATNNGGTLATQLWIANPAAAQRAAHLTFLPENTDGTARNANLGTSITVQANGNSRVGDPGANGRVGMLEVDLADGSFLQAARLTPDITNFSSGRTTVPVVSSANLVPANGVAALVGLMHVDTGIRSDVGIMNLGQAAAQCQALFFRSDGVQIGSTATVTFPPLSLRHFSDVLGDVNLTDARAQITCDHDFYAYATVRGTDGQVAYFIPPALSGASTLVRPGATTPPPPTTAGCGKGSVCYDYPGIVHISTKVTPDHSIRVTPPSAAYSRLKAHVDVTINGWSTPVTGAHGILYLVRDRNKNMYLNAFLRGPSSNQLSVRHGFDQTSGQKPKITKSFAPIVGQTYAVDYVYDPVNRTLVFTMSLHGQEVVRITGQPNVRKVQIDPGQQIVMGLSNPGRDPSEPASFGWVYQNLHLELVP